MELQSLADVLVIVVYLVPGFVAFQIVNKVVFIEREFSDFEVTVWSLFGSLCIYSVFSLTIGISSLEQVRQSVFYWQYLIPLVFLSVTSGLVVGILGKVLFRRGLKPGDCWEVAFDKIREKGAYVIVYTADGLEFKGMVEYYDSGNHRRQLVLGKPKLILRDNKWNVTDEIEFGKRVLFTDDKIKEVVFL